MVGDAVEQHCPALRAVEADKNVGEQDDGEGFGAVAQAIDRLIQEATQHLQIPSTQQADRHESDQTSKVGEDVLGGLQALAVRLVLELAGLAREGRLQFLAGEGLPSLQQGLELQLLLVETQFVDRLFLKVRLGVVEEGDLRRHPVEQR